MSKLITEVIATIVEKQKNFEANQKSGGNN